MAVGKIKNEAVAFGGDDEFVGTNISSLARGKFIKKPTDRERSDLYSLLASMLESGFSYREAVEFLTRETAAERSKLAAPVRDFFAQFEEWAKLSQDERATRVGEAVEQCFGKGGVFGEELLALRAMVSATNPVPLLKLASALAEKAAKREQGRLGEEKLIDG
jgi:hypothetical protein